MTPLMYSLRMALYEARYELIDRRKLWCWMGFHVWHYHPKVKAAPWYCEFCRKRKKEIGVTR